MNTAGDHCKLDPMHRSSTAQQNLGMDQRQGSWHICFVRARARGTGKRSIIIQACIGRIGELQSMGHLEWNRGTSVADELYSSRTVDYSLTTRILA
jgi:hypothetical protein